MDEHDEAPHVRRVSPQQESVEPIVKAKKPPREKLTGEDVEARFKEFGARLAEKKAGRPVRSMGGLVKTVTACALGLGIVLCGVGLSNANDSHQAESKVVAGQISTVEGSLLETIPAKDLVVAEVLTKDLTQARERSDALAKIQSDFATIAYAGNDDPPVADGLPNVSLLKSLEHGRASVDFFTPESLLLSDDQAYVFRTNDVLGAGRIDPRTSWFIAYDISAETGKNKASDPGSYGWKTASVMPSTAPGVVAVTWTNVDADGNLLAWAAAKYENKSGLFSGFRLNTTTTGDIRGKAYGTTEGSK